MMSKAKTKAKAKAKAPRKKLPDSVSLREIEAGAPCFDEYRYFLLAIKSNPVTDSYYDSAASKRFTSPQFGPDDKIPLKLIWGTKASPNGYHGHDGKWRVVWLINNIKRLTPLRNEMRQIRSDKLRILEKQHTALRAQLDKMEAEISDMEDSGYGLLFDK